MWLVQRMVGPLAAFGRSWAYAASVVVPGPRSNPAGAPGAAGALRCALLALTALAACRGPAGGDAADDGVPAWTIDAAPLLQLGSAEGDSARDLFEVTGAVRLPDGTIVVGNRGTWELRYFAANGSFRHHAGGRGGGPGEFTSLGRIDAAGDTVLAFDYENCHLALFDTAGALIRTVPLATPPGSFPPQYLGRLPDGGMLASAIVMRQRTSGPAEGMHRDTLTLWTYDASGRPVTKLGTFPGSERHVVIYGGSARRGVAIAFHPFYRKFLAAAGGGRIYAGATDSARLDVFDRSGRPLPELRWTLAVAPAPDDLRDRYLEHELAQLRDPLLAPAVRRDIESMPLPERLPEFLSLLVDREGALWVRDYDLPWSHASRWRVFDPAGRLVASADAPAGLDITDAGRDWVLGIVTDELGVEYVRLHRLRRN